MTDKFEILSADDLRLAFQKATNACDNETNNQVIGNLSRALSALQNAGIDIVFEVTGWCGTDCYKAGGNQAVFGGVLRFGHNEHVLSLIENKSGKRVLSLTYWNKGLGDIQTKVLEYDISNPQCYALLQKQIIQMASRTAYVAKHDANNAFSYERAHTKARTVNLLKQSSSSK